jgi:hypothetical protein|tara:strand:+ start:168 stop:530 length:363 start_codon:yes stop_codon:yes gene_type:complete
MDLLKMHPMARKMEQHQKAFLSNLEDGDANLAKQHLSELQKLADFLSEDLNGEIAKAENLKNGLVGPNDIFAGGVPVLKFTDSQGRKGGIEGRKLPGVIANGIRKSQFSKTSGTFGRYSE